MINNLTPYIKKNINYSFRDHNLEFVVAQELFSSTDIDTGTQRLLRTLVTEKFDTYNKVLDVGCGYGPIGICLKKYLPQSTVHMVDRDALAVAFSKLNAEKNGLHDIQIYGSLGYDDVKEKDFDLLISNVPAKIGEKALHYWLTEAQWYLTPQGKVVIVVIEAIFEAVMAILTTNENIRILFQKKWSGHIVIGYAFTQTTGTAPQQSAFERGIFDREETQLFIDENQYPVKTTYGLPEFDSLSFPTGLLIHKLKEKGQMAQNILIFNNGQGHIALAVSQLLQPVSINLIDRNVQALRTTEQNLIANQIPQKQIRLFFEPGILVSEDTRFDAVVGVLSDDEGIEVHHMYCVQAAQQLKKQGRLYISGNSTAITRVEHFIHQQKLFDVVERKKTRGNSTLILQKK